MEEKKSELYSREGLPLAIATIPCQKWSDIYEAGKALDCGTIFPELNLPFFAASTLEETKDVGKREKNGENDLLKKIDEVSFIINDLTLYLDTHETDGKALSLLGETLRERQRLMKEFAIKFYPLTQTCMADEGSEGTKFRWTDGPAPWEGACR